MPTTEPVIADRLMLVSMLTVGDYAIELSETVMVRPGQRHWVEGSTYYVQSPDGRTRAVEGSAHTICRR